MPRLINAYIQKNNKKPSANSVLVLVLPQALMKKAILYTPAAY